MFETKAVDKISTHDLCSNLFQKKNAVYEIMWTNMLQPDRP